MDGAGPPPEPVESPHPPGADVDALGGEERPLQGKLTVAAQGTARGDHAVVGQPGPLGPGQDVADRPRRPGTSGHRRDVAVGRDAARRHARHHRQDTALEGAGRSTSGR